MGLDMFLTAERYVRDYKGESVEVNAKGHYGTVTNFTTEVKYWRKANAIHGWFVRNVQNGTDDCKRYPVYREHIEMLSRDIQEALDNRDKINDDELDYSNPLEPTRGCFFGSYEIDMWYFDQLKDTGELFNQLLSDNDFWEYNQVFYQSSW